MNLIEILNRIKDKTSSAFFYTPKIYKNGKSVLFGKASEIMEINSLDECEKKFERIHKAINEGKVGFTLINYEAGYLFEKKFWEHLKEISTPLMKFYLFDKREVEKYNYNEIEYDINTDWDIVINGFELNVTEDEYLKNIEKIKNYIKEGDTYQVNYTVKGKFRFEGNIADLFLKLIFNQSAKYSAIINDQSRVIISVSPELFFSVDGKKISAHPMKGTIHRGININEDKLRIEQLKHSEKNKAENTMILDLLRNDLGKISQIDSVEPKAVHKIETYESLHQMISIVNAETNSNSLFNLLKNLFPCGSITGAPKVQTMQIIKEMENEERGIYTGSICLIEKDNYNFNIPIRTIEIEENGSGKIGIGSGIVWDSNPQEEFEEVKLKANFLTKSDNYFELFETILVDKKEIFLFDIHFDRLKESAGYFLFNFNRDEIEAEVGNYLDELSELKRYKMKLLLSKWGDIKIKAEEIKEEKKILKITVSNNRIDSQNKFQYFKTTNRKMYDNDLNKYKEQGYDEVIYLNEKNELTEGAITNIFLQKKGEWFTPKTDCGLLEGCYRKYFIQKNNVTEKELLLADILQSDKMILTNSVRKEITVKEIWLKGELFKEM
ncbi:MAG: aminodeoxychorismate synthase component I [Ignavibacteria bacterium]|jgi:para-aminobenzoate synthetase/4-amino-4-deoxychorismate lyase